MYHPVDVLGFLEFLRSVAGLSSHHFFLSVLSKAGTDARHPSHVLVAQRAGAILSSGGRHHFFFIDQWPAIKVETLAPARCGGIHAPPIRCVRAAQYGYVDSIYTFRRDSIIEHAYRLRVRRP